MSSRGQETVTGPSTSGIPADTAGRSTHCMLHTVAERTVLRRPGLVDDLGWSQLGAVAEGGVHVRLILGELRQSCACCINAPAVIVAVDGNDPSLPEGLAAALHDRGRDGGRGVALATVEADHLSGTLFVTETVTMRVRAAGVNSGNAVVIDIVDALALLADTPALATVAVFEPRPGMEPPAGWSAVAQERDRVGVTEGWAPPTPALVGPT